MQTSTYSKLLSAVRKAQTIVLQGGTSSGKTYSVLEFAVALMASEKSGSVLSVVAESLPHLRRGAIRDFLQKLDEKELYFEKWHNKSNNSYTFPGHGTIEFFGADNPDALRGGRRDYLFVNEANRIPFEAFEQLHVRTKKKTFIDFNPSSRFWAHEYADQNRGDTELFISTYKDNCFLDERIIKKIEAKKPKYNDEGILISGSPNWWKVYGEGQIGSHEGIIFQEGEHWKYADDFAPTLEEAKVFGLDFGYSSDEASLSGVWDYADGFFAKCLMYEIGMDPEDYPKFFEKIGLPKKAKIYADSATPMLIEYIRKAGWTRIEGTKKYAGSVLDGISAMKSKPIYITREDIVAKNELQNYEWKPDRLQAEKYTDTPIGADHFLDALRYAIFGITGKIERVAHGVITL
jgi:phage terminase large subunit